MKQHNKRKKVQKSISEHAKRKGDGLQPQKSGPHSSQLGKETGATVHRLMKTEQQKIVCSHEL